MKTFSLLCAGLLAAFLVVIPTEAYWIISHHPLVSQRLDPILSGSGTSGHTHSFVGSAAILPSSDVNSSCTTSPVKADKSNYWQPALYYFNATTGNFSSVPLGFVNTYYLQRGGSVMGQNTSNIGVLPRGLRMIAGSAVLYDAPNSNAQAAAAINYVCLDYSAGTTFSSTIPKGPCPDGLRAQVVFPSCWNGVDLDSSDHQSHMSYPLGNNPDNGDCPASHPHKLVTLFYEFIWSTGYLTNSDNGALVLANGDTVGYSLHADFISGWDETVLRQAIDQCDGQLGGDLAGCPPFVPSLKDEVAGTINYCSTSAAVQETVSGSALQYLPGCQPIRNGKWKGVGTNCVPTTPNITTPQLLNQTGGTVVPSGFTNMGCYAESSSRILASKSYSKSTNTPATCTAFCSAAGYRYAGVEYGSECYCGNYILNSGAAALADSSSCNMLCSGDKFQSCGGSSRIQVYQNQTWSPSIWTVQSYKQWKFSDCAVDTLSPRTLPTGISVGSGMTVESCLDACAAKNMTQCGMEYSGECYGSTTIRNFTSAPSVGSSDPQARGCSMPCAGNSSEACGGSAKLNLYTLLPASTNSTAVASNVSTTNSPSSALTTTSSSSASSISSTATVSAVAQGSAASTSLTNVTSSTSTNSSTSRVSTSASSTATILAATTVIKNVTSTSTTTTVKTVTASATKTTTTTSTSKAKRTQLAPLPRNTPPSSSSSTSSSMISTSSSSTSTTTTSSSSSSLPVTTRYTSTAVVTRVFTAIVTQTRTTTSTHTSTATIIVKKAKRARQADRL